MKIILMAGPPSSGKDTAAKYLYREYKDHPNITNMVFERYSQPLKGSFAAITNTSMNEFFENEIYEPIKDEVIPWLGVSYRQYQINLSEKHLKPLYGYDIFGKLFVERTKHYHPNSVLVVPDSGFSVEITVAEKTFDPKEVLLIRCHRRGKTFEGDSREYTYSEKFASLDLNNNGSVGQFEDKVDDIFVRFLVGQDVSKFNEEIQV